MKNAAKRRPDCRVPPAACLCGQRSGRVVWRERGYEAKQCRCGMVYTEAASHETSLDETHELHPPSFYVLPAAFKAAWVAAHCPPGRLVEVGCGDGTFLSAVQRHGYEVWGIEPHHTRAAQARARGFNIDVNYLEHTALAPHSFDVVYHCDMLSHFRRPASALRQMCLLLRPGGVLCFEVGLQGGVAPFWYALNGELGLRQHHWLYSKASLQQLLATCGLEIVHERRFGLAPAVLLSRVSTAFMKYVLAPAMERLGAEEDRALDVLERWQNFLRYSIGSLAPAIGPQTLFVVARPYAYACGSEQ